MNEMMKTMPPTYWKKHCPMCGDWFAVAEGNTDSYCPSCRAYADKFERDMRGEEVRDGE